MAFGLLNSIIPSVGQPDSLYTGTSDTLTVGKVSISSKSSTPARIQLAYEDGGSLRYFEYNKTIKYGETYETQDIHVGAGQKLVVRSDQTDINFFFYGQTISDALHPVRSGVLSHIITTDKQKRSIFTAPTGSQVNVTLSVCNMGVEASTATIGVSNAGLDAFDSTEYVEYSKRIEPGQTYTRTDIKIKEGQTIIGFSNRNSMVSFVCHGQLFYAVSGLLDSDDKMLLGHARIEGNLGVGITATSKLHVLGDTKLDGSLSLTGDLTSDSQITVKGIKTNLFSNSLIIKDNNLEIGYFTNGSFIGDITAGQDKILNVQDTSNIVPGLELSIDSPQTVTIGISGINTITAVGQNEVTLMTPLTGNGTNNNIQFDHSGPTDKTADGGGIKLYGDTIDPKTITWLESNDRWNLSHGVNIPTLHEYRINDVVVLNSNQVLGFAVTTLYQTNYDPEPITGISTSYIPTQKSTDDLISARQKDMGLSAFFASGF